jgi:leader peptidase (prepilin peptidase)/N-methyltransferase
MSTTTEASLSAPPRRERLVSRPVPVAAIGGALAVAALAVHSLGLEGVIAAVLAAVLVTVSVTDLERRVIPNRVVLPATGVVLLLHFASTPSRALTYLIAALAAGGAFLVLNLVSRNGIGMGDVKLAALLGAGLGTAVVGALVIGSLSLFPFALAVLVRGGLQARKSTLPFGPFLAFGGLFVLIVTPLVASAGG